MVANEAHPSKVAHDLRTMVERMSVQSLHEMHAALWPLLVANADDAAQSRELRACASAIEAELISRSQAVARYQF